MWFWGEMSLAEQAVAERWVTDRFPGAAVTMSMHAERELWRRFHSEWSRDNGPDYNKDVWRAREYVLLARIRPPGSRRENL